MDTYHEVIEKHGLKGLEGFFANDMDGIIEAASSVNLDDLMRAATDMLDVVVPGANTAIEDYSAPFMVALVASARAVAGDMPKVLMGDMVNYFGHMTGLARLFFSIGVSAGRDAEKLSRLLE